MMLISEYDVCSMIVQRVFAQPFAVALNLVAVAAAPATHCARRMHGGDCTSQVTMYIVP